MKKSILLLLVSCCLTSVAQTSYRTQVFHPSVKTLQIRISGKSMVLPILELKGHDVLQVSFDEMSYEAHSYSYTVLHCNGDWTPSGLASSEYLGGFTTANITNSNLSVNTTVLYTNYAFNLPNDDMYLKISGNYVVLIYEDNNRDKPVAQACFSVVEPRVGIVPVVRGNTDTELNGRLQQLDFEVSLGGYTVRDPNTEIKVVVRQNNRIDNQVANLKPTFISGSKLSFINNNALIFEGGNEYHRFDISSVYAAGEGVETIRYNRQQYEAVLYPDKIQTSRTYIHNPDVNGKFVINLQQSDYNDVEADYMMVNFRLPAKSPFFDGQVYLGGEFNYNLLNDISRMKYDNNSASYYHPVMLKQGGYNYQYWFVPKGSAKASVERVDGSYWQTRNQYTVYVYHRPWGERYDKLIGVKDFE